MKACNKINGIPLKKKKTLKDSDMKNDLRNVMALPEEVAEAAEKIVEGMYYPSDTHGKDGLDYYRMVYFYPDEARRNYYSAFGKALLGKFLKGEETRLTSEEFDDAMMEAHMTSSLAQFERMGLLDRVDDGNGFSVYGFGPKFIERITRMEMTYSEEFEEIWKSFKPEMINEVMLDSIIDDENPVWKSESYVKFAQSRYVGYWCLCAMRNNIPQEEFKRMFFDIKELIEFAMMQRTIVTSMYESNKEEVDRMMLEDTIEEGKQ